MSRFDTTSARAAACARTWTPAPGWTRVLTVDAHAAGEPLRVILDGFPDPGGSTVLERRRRTRRTHDTLRRALMWEPRGHADMYGCIVGPPTTPGADFSVLFTHNDGFSTMCGHGIIGVVTVLGEIGFLGTDALNGGGVHIDTPAGPVEARADGRDGRVWSVSFVNVPSFAARLDASVDVPDLGPCRYDLAYGGAFYAYVDAADFGLSLVPSEGARLIDLGRRIKRAVQTDAPPEHPDDPDLGFVYGTIFVGPAHDDAHSRNVCVFADGEVDRSPTGTGVSGRLALHRARGELELDREIVVESILGTRFSGRILSETNVGERDAVVPEVTGRAWITGRNEFVIAPDDPLRDGFLLR
jgi:trans-L-3-hydroxyproline dehydratase